MVLFNICGQPGAGKTITAMELCLAFKKRGYHAELVGEAARENHIYRGTTRMLDDNQYAVSGEQWERVLRLARYGCEVAISDSPLIQCLLYAKHLSYYKELEALIGKCGEEFTTYDIFVHRAFPYRAEERRQTEELAAQMANDARQLVGQFWLEIKGNDEGIQQLISAALQVV